MKQITINYPNGRQYRIENNNKRRRQNVNLSYSNRGMTLEEDINETNKFYLAHDIAVIHKKPTPVQIVNVDYPHRSAAVITEAYFKLPSTTDYNGLYKGHYVDFEVKETRSKTSFPLKNIHDHQITHMKNIINHGGICFLLIRFASFEKVFFLDAKQLFLFWERMKDGGRKSITKQELVEHGYKIPLGFQPRIDYIKLIDQLYNL